MQQLYVIIFEAGNHGLVFDFGPLHNHHGAVSMMNTIVTYTA